MNDPNIFASKISSKHLESLEGIELSLMMAKKMKAHLLR